jgi:hypothetical protein
MANESLLERLRQHAWNRSQAFCYSCYKTAPSGRCTGCGSDDLMRQLDGVGCEWGIEWVMRHLLEENVTPFDTEEAFEESLRGCYPQTVEVGWLKLDTVDILKEMDAVAWDLACDEWVDAEHSDGNLITLDHGAS